MTKKLRTTFTSLHRPELSALEGARILARWMMRLKGLFPESVRLETSRRVSISRLHPNAVMFAMTIHNYVEIRDRVMFDETLASATLAIVRAGHALRIHSGSEVWVARLEMGRDSRREVLVFEILTGRRNIRRTCVEIAGLSEDVLAEVDALVRDAHASVPDLTGS